MKKMVDLDWMGGLKEEKRRITWRSLRRFSHFFSSYLFSFFRRPDFLAKLDALMEPSENVVVENENCNISRTVWLAYSCSS